MECLANVDGLGELCQQATPITVRVGAFLTRPDYAFASVSSFMTEADWLTAIAAGNIFPLQLIQEQENQDVEDAVLDTGTGNKVFQYEGTRGQMWKFILPLDLHKILKNQYSLKSWRMFELDKNGNVIGTSPDGTAVQGFRLSYFRVGKQETPSSDTAAYTPVEFQKADIKEYDANGVYGNPTWIASDLYGILKVDLTVSTVTANAFTATVAWLSNSEIDNSTDAFKTFAISNLVAANFNVIDQVGALMDPASDYTATESTATPGTYTIDVSVGGLTSGTCQVIASTTELFKSDIETLSA